MEYKTIFEFLRIETTWELWEKFLVSLKSFENWLTSSEVRLDSLTNYSEVPKSHTSLNGDIELAEVNAHLNGNHLYKNCIID